MTSKREQLMTEIEDLSSSRLEARLKNTSKDAGVMAWERCTIAHTLLNRTDFTDNFKSNDAATAHLEDRYLADLIAFSVDIDGSGVFFQLIQEFPEFEDWEKCNFDLCMMYATYQENRPEKENGKVQTRRRATLQQLDELDSKLKSSKAREAKLAEQRDQKDEEITVLRAEIAKLEGKLEIMQEILDNWRDKGPDKKSA